MTLLTPLQNRERVKAVDALRGLALFGILVANIPFPGESLSSEPAGSFLNGSQKLENALKFLFQLFIDKKFITIFSMLFGFGFYIQMQRVEEKGIAFRPYFFKRMLILLMIGSIHAYLFWFGDIIRYYAIGGMFLLLAYRWQPRKILITAIIFSAFLTGIVFIANGVFELQTYSYDLSLPALHPLATTFWHYLQINARIDPIVNFVQDSPLTLVFCFGNMLIGFWMAKSGFFHQTRQFTGLRKKFIVTGIIVGISASYLLWLITTGKMELTPALIWLPIAIAAGLVLQSLFYISAFINLFLKNRWSRILSVFAPVGKMALTNYLVQTFYFLFIFFHWSGGLQLYGKLSLAETYLVAILLFSFQVLFSYWWLNSNDQGPVEHLWKTFAYRFSKTKMVNGKNVPEISSVL